jgi:hypothetical protein
MRFRIRDDEQFDQKRVLTSVGKAKYALNLIRSQARRATGKRQNPPDREHQTMKLIRIVSRIGDKEVSSHSFVPSAS